MTALQHSLLVESSTHELSVLHDLDKEVGAKTELQQI